MKHLNEVSEHTKHFLDGLSGVAVLGTIVQILPAIAALFSIVWYGIRIYDRLKSKK